MLDGDEVTSEVTLEKYLSAVDSISKVRNEELKDKYTELADKVATQMGYTGYSTYTPASTESYSEDTSAGDGTWTDQSSDVVY